MSPVRGCKSWFGGVVPIMEQEKGRRPGHAPEHHYARFEGLRGDPPGAECNEYRALPAQDASPWRQVFASECAGFRITCILTIREASIS